MKTTFAAVALPLLLVPACAAPSADDVAVEADTDHLAPKDCREAFEDLWGADHASLPNGSECGQPTGGSADAFPSDHGGGKTDACLPRCNDRYSACVDRCVERYPDAPTAATTTPTKMVKGGSLPGATSSQGAGMHFTPPAGPSPADVARGKCIATCGVTLQACSRGCAAQR